MDRPLRSDSTVGLIDGEVGWWTIRKGNGKWVDNIKSNDSSKEVTKRQRTEKWVENHKECQAKVGCSTSLKDFYICSILMCECV